MCAPQTMESPTDNHPTGSEQSRPRGNPPLRNPLSQSEPEHMRPFHAYSPGDQFNAQTQTSSKGSGPQFHGNNFNAPVYMARGDGWGEAERLRKEREACLQSLSFPNMDARQDDIANAYPHTCDWLFSTAKFKEWRDLTDPPTHNGVLWIKGKPGAGKSTLMKRTLHRCEEVFNDHLIVAYFFNARGKILEQTPLGMLRSIIYQLLNKDTELYESFVSIFREQQRIYKKANWEWRQSQLQEFVLSTTKERKSKPLLFLVDALDECDVQDVRDVVDFLESLSISAARAGVAFRICLSSRHYPSISMKKALELTVEENQEHRKDIATYVGERLSIRDDDIEAEIRKKADGIFMWVVIVVSLLNKAYDEGRMEVLEQVPGDLEKVFNILLSNGDQNKAETMLMLQWVLLSQRPLTPEELFAAVVQGQPPTSDTIQRRITTASKGLIEVRKGDTASVQFIHLSVNDFLLRIKRLQKLDQTLEPDPISASHLRLWDRCWSCIKQPDSTLPSEQHMRGWINENPFLEVLLDEEDIKVDAQGSIYGNAL
ncbi:hypothetical protein F5X68DRAFT_243102 [Plectosphaerella plurivora]|uniref:Nephrocystin 3-like N-terminal domain-containing protein n=1 Tax=Plectosphaerella plurivora TaxID=936078 RepID=A0A9P8V736_9PEZI|nr:hypothetical protein F5X68DRAFT_243102 [Plectosphaerella plurivora]